MTRMPEQSGSMARRLLPLALLLAATVLAYGMGWHKLLSFKTIGLHYEALRSFIDAHMGTAVFSMFLSTLQW